MHRDAPLPVQVENLQRVRNIDVHSSRLWAAASSRSGKMLPLQIALEIFHCRRTLYMSCSSVVVVIRCKSVASYTLGIFIYESARFDRFRRGFIWTRLGLPFRAKFVQFSSTHSPLCYRIRLWQTDIKSYLSNTYQIWAQSIKGISK